MKQDDNNESIKQNRGDLKFQVARLQSIIIDSMKRPTLPLAMVLQIILMLQMFRAPFSYLNSLLVNPTWAYIPLFNYLIPAYYQIYMTPFGFMCILIFVLVLMLLYLIGIVLLVATSRHSKFSKVLAKIMRVKLEIYSTVLFPSIIKTILTILHCSSPNVSTDDNPTEFKCLFQDQPSWITWLAIILFALFTCVILLQSYLKFEFYKHPTRSGIIRKSQQWIPLLLIFHFVIQIVAITQTKLILLLVMNIIPAAMIAHLFFMEQTLTQISHKTSQSISYSLMYLMLFIDVNYFLGFPLSYLFWYLTLGLLIPTSILYPRLNIKYQLTNINKWNSATDRLQYCSGLRTVLGQKKSIMSLSIIQGYSDIHYQKCQLVHCPFRLNKQGLDRIRIFRENKNISDAEIRIEELIIKIYSEGTKYFPNVTALSIEFAIFLYQRNMKQRAIKFLLSSSIQNVSLEEYYKFYRLRKILHQELISKGESTLDLLTQMQMRDLEQDFLRSVEKTSLSDMELWSVLLEQHPDFGKLDQVGGERIQLGEYVKKLYSRISQKGNSQRITSLYVQYLINVCKQGGNFTDVEQTIKKKYFLNEKIVVFDWANSSHPSLVISGEEKSFGEIEDLNLSAAILLGYQKTELINRKLSFIMPEDLQNISQELISLKDTFKQFYLLRKDRYMIKITKNVYISSSIMKGSIFICTLQPMPINPLSCKIIVNPHPPFNIIGMESKVISFFGIQTKQTDEAVPLSQISQLLSHSLANCIMIPKDIKLQQLLTTNLLRRMKPTDQELMQQFSIKINCVCQKFTEIQFLKKKNPPKPKINKPKINQFKFQPILLDGNMLYSNNLTTKYQYITNKIEVQSGTGEQVIDDRMDYGKGIRTVRLDYDEVMIIEQSSSQEQSQPKSTILIPNNLGISVDTNVGNQNKHKSILSNRQSVREFVSNYSPGKNNKAIMTGVTVMSIILFVIICFVYRQNHNGIVSDLYEYVDENLKIGQIQLINVLVIQSSLRQQNRSSVTSTSLISQFQQTLSDLQIQKNLGHVYSINTTMLDGTYQTLTNLQYIDSLNFNIRQLMTALENGSSIPENSVNFSINNERIVQPQMINYLIGWDSFIQSSFNKSLVIQTVIIVLFMVLQICFLSFIIYKVYQMFNDKICVLKVFLQISEQNVRIMSIKTQQFLNTLYNNETDIDDEETIIRKTNNKHTFAIKKKFKLIRRNNIIYVMLGIIFLVLIAIPLVSFGVSANNLVFMRKTLPFINGTSSGKAFFYHHLHNLQLNILRSTEFQNPAYQYIQFYKVLMTNFYQTFSTLTDFADYWTSIMMENICSGRTQIQNGCLTATSDYGGMALITELVLTTITITTTPAVDYATSYYNLYRIFGHLHKSLSQHVLNAFQQKVDVMKNLLIILLIVSVILAPALLMMIGMRVIENYTQQIDHTRKMLSLLPIEYLRSCQSINQYLSDSINRKQWGFC